MSTDTADAVIEAPPAQQQTTAVATTPPARAAIALQSPETEAALRALVVRSATIVEIKNKAGRDEAHSAAMDLLRARTAIEKRSKEARADATAFSKAVIAEENRLISITQAEEDRVKALRDSWDAAREAERAEAARLERQRVIAITERIAEIKQLPVLAAQCRTAAAVQRLVDKAAAINLADMAEFEGEARTALDMATQTLATILADKTADEARRAAEQEARERMEREQAELREQLAQARADLAKANLAALEAVKAQPTEPAAEQQKVEPEPAPAPEPEPEPQAVPAAQPDPVAEQAQPAAQQTIVDPMPVTMPITMADQQKVDRPSAMEIVLAVSEAFGVSMPEAALWIRTTDFSTL